MKELGFEFLKNDLNQLDYQPEMFAKDGHPVMTHHWNYGLIFPEGEEKPYFYMRSMTPTRFRSGNLVNLGDGPLEPQSPSPYYDKMAQRRDTEPYHFDEEKGMYVQETENPLAYFAYGEKGGVWKEADVLDINYEYFPYTIATHFDSPYGLWGFCYMHRHLTWSGTIGGKKFHGLGCLDRTYELVDDSTVGTIDAGDKFLALALMSGIREDGRKECAFVAIAEKQGYGFGCYWLEGEEPIVTDEVYLYADWQTFPYAPDDPTLTYTQALWKFAGKEIHTTMKWASKGHTQEPRYSIPGFSNSYGPWYEGSVPYSHTEYNSFCENHSATMQAAKDANLL